MRDLSKMTDAEKVEYYKGLLQTTYDWWHPDNHPIDWNDHKLFCHELKEVVRGFGGKVKD